MIVYESGFFQTSLNIINLALYHTIQLTIWANPL
jgi:hypothetical protein